jgi:hypothetical protein
LVLFGFVGVLLVENWRRDRQAKEREIYIKKFFLLLYYYGISLPISHLLNGGQTMAIIDTLHEAQFVDEFRKIRENDFSFDGLKVLFRYLDDLSEDCGENIEFDPIGFCCEFDEYNLEEFNNDYDMNIESFETFEKNRYQNELDQKRIQIIDFFTSRDFVNGEWITEEKVLVHNG